MSLFSIFIYFLFLQPIQSCQNTVRSTQYFVQSDCSFGIRKGTVKGYSEHRIQGLESKAKSHGCIHVQSVFNNHLLDNANLLSLQSRHPNKFIAAIFSESLRWIRRIKKEE